MVKKEVLLFPFYRWENQGLGMLNYLPEFCFFTEPKNLELYPFTMSSHFFVLENRK